MCKYLGSHNALKPRNFLELFSQRAWRWPNKGRNMSPWQYTIFIVYKIKCSVIDWQVVFVCYNTSGWKTIKKKRLRYNAILNSRYCTACRRIVVSTFATLSSRSRFLGLLRNQEHLCENLRSCILLYIPWFVNWFSRSGRSLAILSYTVISVTNFITYKVHTQTVALCT